MMQIETYTNEIFRLNNRMYIISLMNAQDVEQNNSEMQFSLVKIDSERSRSITLIKSAKIDAIFEYIAKRFFSSFVFVLHLNTNRTLAISFTN